MTCNKVKCKKWFHIFFPQVNKIESKFSAHYDAVEVDLKSSTVGLLTVEEMVSRQQSAVQEREKLLAR